MPIREWGQTPNQFAIKFGKDVAEHNTTKNILILARA